MLSFIKDFYGAFLTSYVDMFARDNMVFVIPKGNATLRGSWKRKETMKEFLINTIHYLKEYYRRETQSGFPADKKLFGWSMTQKREDRIDYAQFSIGLWHNLFNLGTQ